MDPGKMWFAPINTMAAPLTADAAITKMSKNRGTSRLPTAPQTNANILPKKPPNQTSSPKTEVTERPNRIPQILDGEDDDDVNVFMVSSPCGCFAWSALMIVG